mmetsp:Transcript_12608/g.43782  ORF Transcript_12608/g.43782 Transcript_12608/m.43782 type:complete len:187 (+) Transcript_12608:258-818(+)
MEDSNVIETPYCSDSDAEREHSVQQFGSRALLQYELASRRARARNRVETMFWIVCSLFSVAYGNSKQDLVHVVLHDTRINSTCLALSLGLCFVVFSLFIYIMRYEPSCLETNYSGVKGDRKLIPLAAFLSILAILGFLLALWPVFGILAGVVLFVNFMGLICCIQLLPEQIFNSVSSTHKSVKKGT